MLAAPILDFRTRPDFWSQGYISLTWIVFPIAVCSLEIQGVAELIRAWRVVNDVKAILGVLKQQAGAMIGGLGEDYRVVGLANSKEEMVDRLRKMLVQILLLPFDNHTLVEVARSAALMLLMLT